MFEKEETYTQKLIEIGALAKQIKKKITASLKEYKTVGALILDLESRIKTSGFHIAFPTLVLNDKILCNYTYDQKLFSTPLEFKICTIDFGIQDPASGAIIDNAITFSSEEHKPLLKTYKQNFLNAQASLQKILINQGSLTLKDISRTITTQFRSTSYTVIRECMAHTIGVNKLHDQGIPMTEDIPLEDYTIPENKPFTIEPHVFIHDKKIKHFRLINIRSNIITFENQIDSIDFRLKKGLENKPFTEYIGLRSNHLTFYQEHTYVYGRDKVLKRLT